MKDQNAEELIQKYIEGKCTPEERALLNAWYSQRSKNLKDEMPEPDYEYWNKRIANNLPVPSRRIISWPRISAAAAILLVAGAGLYIYQYTSTPSHKETKKYANEISPGGNKAFLTLGNGKRIVLTDAKNGELTVQTGVKVTKTADGQLVYTMSELPPEPGAENEEIKDYNVVETPNGGKYEISLPDGTKVWLNAASMLKFPATFARLINRKVELLRGEAYFEVAKDRQKPFIVTTAGQQVEVLGTHFNINAYKDELSTKTTLIEGSIKINNNATDRILKPGQQASIKDEKIEISNVDTDQAIAWKNDDFAFEGISLKVIMMQICRWYDVEVSLDGPIGALKFGGSISRKKSIHEVLKVLEGTKGVHFKIEGRRILVMP